MKMKLEVWMDVDEEAWVNTFGLDEKDVEKDVQVYFKVFVLNQLSAIGCMKDDAGLVICDSRGISDACDDCDHSYPHSPVLYKSEDMRCDKLGVCDSTGERVVCMPTNRR